MNFEINQAPPEVKNWQITEDNFDKLPVKVIEAFKKYAAEHWPEDDAIELGYEELYETVNDAGRREQTVDSCYIFTSYTLDIGEYIFEVGGSEYRKDGGTCPYERNETIYITKKEPVVSDVDKWVAFFEGKTTTELLDALQMTKFPF